MKRGKAEFIAIMLIFSALFVISGQQGCEMGKTQAEKTGIDFSLVSGTDYLGTGKMLNLGDSFYVGVKLENYDKQAKTGMVCIRDNLADSFGGIRQEECRPFSVKAAEVKSTETAFGKTAEKLEPGTTEVYFPESGDYSYRDIPTMAKPYSAELSVSVRYAATTVASGVISVPDQQQPSIAQEPSPITVAVTKSLHKIQDSYKVNLDITLRKQQDAKIFSADFSQENRTYFSAKLEPQAMECATQDGQPATGYIEFGNERLIKCSSFVYLAAKEESYPLVITLNYGVSIERTYPFSIKTEFA